MRVPRTRDGRCTTGSPPRGVTPGHGPTSGPRPPRTSTPPSPCSAIRSGSGRPRRRSARSGWTSSSPSWRPEPSGIGVLMGYAPRSDPAEFLAVARLAAATGTGTFTHVREIVEADPTTPIDGSSEITRAAAETGARMHHCHVNSTSRRHVDRVLGVLDERARERFARHGRDLPVRRRQHRDRRLLPRARAAAGVGPAAHGHLAGGDRRARRRPEAARGAARHRPRRRVRGQVPGRGRPLRRRDAAPVPWPSRTPSSPATRCTCCGPTARPTHASGPFPPAVRHIRGRLGPLPAPCAGWSASPASGPGPRPSGAAPTCRRSWSPTSRPPREGRVGSTSAPTPTSSCIDPTRLTDQATYVDPTRPSVGVVHLLVDGQLVVHDGTLVTDAYPGRPVRGVPRGRAPRCEPPAFQGAGGAGRHHQLRTIDCRRT